MRAISTIIALGRGILLAIGLVKGAITALRYETRLLVLLNSCLLSRVTLFVVDLMHEGVLPIALVTHVGELR